MRLAPPSADRIRELRARDWQVTHPILLGQEPSLGRVLRHYIHGGGSQADHITKMLRERIDGIALSQHITEPGESVFDHYGRVLPSCLSKFCPEYVDTYFDVGPQDRVEVHEMLAASSNEHHSVELPSPINMVLHRQQRHAVRAYSAEGVTLFASSGGYQVFDEQENCFWPFASSRTFSKLITSAPVLRTRDHLVIIQDRFSGENFAHFLFDWITRLGLFLESGLERPDNCVFVMGGLLDDFRSLLLQAVRDTYGVQPDQFLFPEDGLNLKTEGKVYWFSDQVEIYMHPAQLAHPKSIDVIRKLSKAIPIEGGPFQRIYISRWDTGRRRVANEDQVWDLLSRYGFEMVRLADHPLTRQVALVRGAKHIVAPHGMGLAHVSLHTGSPTVLELHHPRIGTDAFAIMAIAMGFQYRFVTGVAAENEFDDFAVSPQMIASELDLTGITPGDGLATRQQNILPGSAAFTGNWSPGAQLEELAAISEDVPQRFPGSAVMRHVRRSPDTWRDSNCGNWWGIAVEPSRIYTASCWVWIPAGFNGREVALSIGEWGRQQRVLGDLAARDAWQRLTATVTAPLDATQCALVFRIDGPDGSVVYSTCWQLESGPRAGEYVATG